MIKLSEVFQKNNFNNYLCILNKNTEEFKNFFPNYLLIDTNINEELLWQSIETCNFMNLKIFFSNLSIFYEKTYNNKVLNILENITEENKNLTIISPLGVFSTLNFINDRIEDYIFERYPVTKVLSNNFLKFHKLHCSLKNKNSILLTFFFHYSYNLGDFFNFFIRNNYCKINSFENGNLILKSFEDGLNLLINNGNFLEKFYTSKLYKDLLNFNLNIKNTKIYDTYIYWKNYFSEESIEYCQCHYTTEREIDNFTYYNLEKTSYNRNYNHNPIKRQISIELPAPETISNYKKFYLENIFQYKSINNLLENYYEINNQKSMKNIKVKSLVVSKKTSVFNWYY